MDIGTSFQQMVTSWNCKNLPPDSTVEYYYDHHMVWRAGTGSFDSLKPPAKLVHNVKQIPNGSYEFEFKGIEGIYRTNYGWAFIPYTEENMRKLRDREVIQKQIDSLNEERIKILYSICKLYDFSKSV